MYFHFIYPSARRVRHRPTPRPLSRLPAPRPRPNLVLMISSLCSLIVVTLDFPSTRSYLWISRREGSSRYSLLGSGCPTRSLNCEKLNLNSRPVTSFRVGFLIRVHRGYQKMNSGAGTLNERKIYFSVLAYFIPEMG